MTLEFESPERLEERIAANMADESDDLSLGINRRGTSFASVSMSNDEISLSQSGGGIISNGRISIPIPPPRSSIGVSSTPHASKIDQERMKAYVLNSVKRTNPLRELRNMSSPRRRPGDSSTPGPSKLRTVEDISQSQDGDSESFISDISSTRDLTVPAKMAARANASFSGVGVNEGATPHGTARVDPIRLQGYLHKINVQLESENVTLKEEKEALKRQFNRALMDSERLRMQLESRGDASAQSKGLRESSESQKERAKEVEDLKKEIDALRIGQDELNDMLDEREAELEAAEQKLKQAQNQDDIMERYRELEDELTEEKEERGRLEEQLREVIHTQRDEKAKMIAEKDEAWAEVDRLKRANASNSGTSDHEKETSFQAGEREMQLESALQASQENQAELERRLEEDAVICEELEAELALVKEDLTKCEEELNNVKDQVMDLQIAAEEKESENIKLNMQLRQAKESTEMQQMREKIVLLESLVEGMKNESIRQSTPMHKNISLLRKPIDTPRSPAELSNASWLNHESTLGDKSVLRNLADLRVKVDQAHAETDEKVAQLGTIQLAQRLVEVQNELDLRDEEIKGLQEKEHRWRKRLERVRCQQCRSRLQKIDLDQSVASRGNSSMTTVHTDGDASLLAKSTRSSHQKEQIVAEIAEQLNELKAKWAIDRARLDEEKGALDEEKMKWTKEKAALQTENRRLKTEKENRRREAKDHVKKMQDGTLRDLSRARRIIAEFERELKQDCARFQEAVHNSRGLDEDEQEVDRELKRTKTKLQQVEQELNSKVDTFEKLQNDLFEKSQMDKSLPLHVQMLEMEVQKFALEVENLRNERNSILEERQKLYQRHQVNQQEYINMHQELRGAKEAITAHQIQLDEQIETIEKLHHTLTQQNKNLEAIHHDRDRLQSQRKEILSDVACLEGDLRRVREESKRFGSDLEKLRAEQEQTKKAEAKVNHKEVQPGMSRQERKQMQKKMILMQQREAASESRHHAECQGLLLQIRYEKAKFMRESDLRSDLIHQKKYIVNLLAGMELVDATTSQFLAAYGRRKGSRGDKGGAPKVNRFRVAAYTVLAVCRAKLMAQHWQQTLTVKKTLREAHQASKNRQKPA